MSAMITVNIKWNKKEYPTQIAPGDTPRKLFEQLEARTGVPIARQKLMAKGAWRGVLKEGMSLDALKAGQNVTLMGTAEVLVKPEQATVFLEDLPEDQKAKSGMVLPAGLANLGNTCYMNSTLQCLRAVPELRGALDKAAAARPGGADLAGALAETYAALDASTKPVEPAKFVSVLRTAFPQFAQRGRGGGFSQQDAEELYSSLLAQLAPALEEGKSIDDLFGLDLEETLVCAETDAEAPVTKRDTARKLICNIQGGTAGQNIDHLHEGLKLGLVGSLDKRSEVLGRDATWTKTMAVSKLSPYLCVQYMRFYWKATPDSQDHAGVKCKIMRPITFTDTLDVWPCCNPGLQEAIKANRDKHGAKLEAQEKAKAEEPEADPELAAALAMSMDTSPDDGGAKAAEHAALLEGCGLDADFQGHYELFAIVTHKGRSADGGHYMGWVKQEGLDKEGKAKWLVFDDDLVSESTHDFVMGLKGGGDEHMSYLQFYRAKKGGI
mmetsp:Transcript_17681/g.52601  ORF Transcript_17681/g.52601 Transcript_17681/m.52601 type:complete len:495 (-) Transcript_17681:36-1520(-)